MTLHVPSRLACLVGLLSAAFVLSPLTLAVAQAPDGKTATGSRAQLIARARVADSLGRKDEAFLLRTRLREGDFEVGDAIIATFEGLALTRRDSLVVGAGKVIRMLEPMGDMSLVGVLRSEIEDSVNVRVAKYFRNIVVHVTPLLRLSVSGAVRLPGFYQSRPDTPLSDLIMRVGQDQTADLRNVTIKRGERVLWSGPDVQSALSEGFTLDRLELDPGDEIIVGSKTTNHWSSIVMYVLPALSVAALLLQQLRR